MTTYKLFLRLVSLPTPVEVTLDSPHKLVPDNIRPSALVYTDPITGDTHNIPFSSIVDFWFNPSEYNACDAGTTLKLPTPGCACEGCTATAARIKEVAKTL